MKIVVIGTGAMGSLFSGRLSPHSVLSMVGSWPEQLAALEQRPLKIINPDDSEIFQQIRATSDIATVPAVDIALILVKCWQTRTASLQAASMLKPEGLCLTLQNGLGNLEILAGEVGRDRAALGVTSEGATMVEAGTVRHAGFGLTHLASTPATGQRLGELAHLFRRAGFQTEVVTNSASLLWGKLAVNAGINPLTALLGVRNGFLADDPTARLVMERAAEETAAVAESQGIQMPFRSAGERALTVAIATARNFSSMVQDMRRGMPTEIGAITGAIVRLGLQARVPTPFNKALLHLMKLHIKGEDWRAEVPNLTDAVRKPFLHLARMQTIP